MRLSPSIDQERGEDSLEKEGGSSVQNDPSDKTLGSLPGNGVRTSTSSEAFFQHSLTRSQMTNTTSPHRVHDLWTPTSNARSNPSPLCLGLPNICRTWYSNQPNPRLQMPPPSCTCCSPSPIVKVQLDLTEMPSFYPR